MKHTTLRAFALLVVVLSVLVGIVHGAGWGVLCAFSMSASIPTLVHGQALGANALGTLSTGTILTRALQLVFTKRPMLNRISLDLTPDNVLLNDVVRSRIFSVPAVTDFGEAAVDRADTDVPVAVNRWKQVKHKFTATEINSTDRQLVDESAEPIAVAIANHLVDAVAALWLPENYANETIEAVADADYETLTAMRGALTGAPDDRFCVVNSSVYTNLLNDPLCNRAQKQSGPDPIADGELSGIAGFQSISEYPGCPTTSNLIGFAGSKDSAVIASRVPKDPREVLPNAPVNGNLEVITLPEGPGAGFSVLAVEYIDLSDLSATVYLTWIYGVAKGNASNGLRLISAAIV